ncbi:hypothetical protein GWK47_009143 [Chionoecetes opilio]|uniref:Uncharacterized protein n=1 Tax=Chionoecetes opilio TaxID=41210 RepID=A0A8J4XYR3_CHIOP|nr:hypothetical protein GWK47_009143 [Chionoecetes opilio]
MQRVVTRSSLDMTLRTTPPQQLLLQLPGYGHYALDAAVSGPMAVCWPIPCCIDYHKTGLEEVWMSWIAYQGGVFLRAMSQRWQHPSVVHRQPAFTTYLPASPPQNTRKQRVPGGQGGCGARDPYTALSRETRREGARNLTLIPGWPSDSPSRTGVGI